MILQLILNSLNSLIKSLTVMWEVTLGAETAGSNSIYCNILVESFVG